MKMLQQPKNQRTDGPKPTDRFTFITDDQYKLVIPVGPRFQAHVQSFTPLSSKSCLTTFDSSSDDSKWLGTRVWPLKGRPQDTSHYMVGRGRPRACSCEVRGSIGCVKRHVAEKKLELEIELGPAFRKWKFNVMGEDACNLWSLEEQRKCDYIMRMQLKSKVKGFMKSALLCFPFHSKRNIIQYYLNVHIPRRSSIQTRMNYKDFDTDDDEDENADNDCGGEGKRVLCPERSRKRCVVFASSSCKSVKTARLESCQRVHFPLGRM